jgi:hypothetical protein
MDTKHGGRIISRRAVDTGLLLSGGKHLQFWEVSFSGGGEAVYPRAEELIALLRNSRGEEVLRRLEPYKGKTLPAGVINPYTYYRA